jgi:hypothetical protein
VACSPSVVQAYKDRGEQFVEEVARNPLLLEEVSGIQKMTANIDLEQCIDSDEEF